MLSKTFLQLSQNQQQQLQFSLRFLSFRLKKKKKGGGGGASFLPLFLLSVPKRTLDGSDSELIINFENNFFSALDKQVMHTKYQLSAVDASTLKKT